MTSSPDESTALSVSMSTASVEDSSLEQYYEELARQQIGFICVGTIGIIGNSMVIFILGSSSKLRSKIINMLLINQSAVDLVTALLMVVSSGIDDRSGGHEGISGWLFCKLWAFKQPMWSVFMSSTYNLACITMERYMEVLHPIYHKTSITRRHVAATIVAVWFIGPAYNILIMVIPTEMINGYCIQMSNWPSREFQMFVAVITAFVEFLIPLAIMTYAYTRMTMRLKTRVHPATAANAAVAHGNHVAAEAEATRRSEKSRRVRRGVMRTFYIVSFAFFFCWAWNQMYFLTFNLGFLSELSGPFYHFTVYIAFVNCVINPFIYAAQYRDFQQQFKKLLLPKWFRPRSQQEDQDQSVVGQQASNVATISANVGTSASANISNTPS